MRAVWIAAWVGMLASPLACGEAFNSDGSSGLGEACERFCDDALGCPDVGENLDSCVADCTSFLPESGSCAPRAIALVDCYRQELNGGCMLSPACMPQAIALAECQGFGCDADVFSCGGNSQYDCWCSGVCGSGWNVSTPCNEDGNGNLLCDCTLTGSLLPYAQTGSLTISCEGPSMCNESWGCCREELLPNWPD